MTLWSDPKYRALALVAAKMLGSTDGDIVAAILAQWTCEKGNADAYPPARNNPGNLARGAASGLGYPFHIDYPNPQPGNPIVTFDTPTHGAQAYAKLILTGSRYSGVRAAVKAGDGYAYVKAMGASGYGTGTACMLSAYHPPTATPPPPPEGDYVITYVKGEDWTAKNGVLRAHPHRSDPAIVKYPAGTIVRTIAVVSTPGDPFEYRLTEYQGKPAFLVAKRIADMTRPDWEPTLTPGVDAELSAYIARQ